MIMTKKVLLILIALLFTFTSTDAIRAAEKGNSRKGKYAYRNLYKECHARGEIDSKKAVLNPDAKTQAQWKRIFDKKKFEIFECKEEWEKLSEQDLLNIFTYLHGHAADSPAPAKCK